MADTGPDIETPRYGPQPAVDSIVTRDPETGAATLFAINRSVDRAVPLSAKLQSRDEMRLIEAIRLHADDPDLTNTADEPNRVIPRAVLDATCAESQLEDVLPPLSWNVYRFAPARW
jgi:alpha-N-arabinofuranosidase